MTRARRTEEGASAVEYGLLVALIAGVIVAAVIGLGLVVHKGYSGSCEQFKSTGKLTTSSSCDD